MTSTPALEPTTSPTVGQAPPNAGDQPNPMYDRLLHAHTPSDWAIRIVLVAVMTAALAVGTWSIYTLLTEVFHVPNFIALLGCGMFDGAALFFALLSQRYATTTDSGLAPRAAMLLMVTASSWVNWKHAQLEHWGTVGGVILAAAPGIAELSFLMFHKFAHRETLRNLGRVPQALPTLGKWAWLAHPLRARKTVDAHIKAALTEHEAVAERREHLAADRAKSIVTLYRPAPEVQVQRVPAPTDIPQVPRFANPEVLTVEVLEPVRNQVREPVTPNLEPAPQVPNLPDVPRTSEVDEPQVRELAQDQVREPAKPRTKPTPEPANLGDRAANKQNQIDQVLNLINELGYDAVKLGLVIERTGMTKTTAYHRLNDARGQWAKRHAA